MSATEHDRADVDCPMCEGRGIVECTDYVEHIPVRSGRECEFCGGDGKLPVLQVELVNA